jgi:archaeal type IV pilus assembly protein PilA
MKDQESGVSPVVGVMLMLAVTIMIAAIVSATAGNFSNTEKKAPSAILDVSIYAAKDYGSFSTPTMIIRHVSGNVLQTKDLQIVTYYTVPGTGNISRGSLMGETAVQGESGWSDFSESDQCGALFINDENRFGSDTVQSSSSGHGNWFGNSSAVFKPGDILVTPAQYCGNSGDAKDSASSNLHRNPGMEKLFPNVIFIEGNGSNGKPTGQFPAGNVVSVKIIHTPSGQIIFDKDVVIS